MNKEIIAKTISAKGRIHSFTDKSFFLNEDVSKLLGCWIINLDYKVENKNNDIYIFGTYDIQLWYATNNDQKTNVYNEKVRFEEKVSMVKKEELTFDDEVFYKVIIEKYPYCQGMELKENKEINLQIESSYIVNEFKEALINVDCSNVSNDLFSLEDEIVMNVNPNYLESKKE